MRLTEADVPKKERIVRQWFDMWLERRDSGIAELFADDAVYIESWGPEYHGVDKIKLWFDEWNTRGTVLSWEIRQFFHVEGQTIVRWHFRCRMQGEEPGSFEGLSLITWTADGRIAALQEFGCKDQRYDPYADGGSPKFESTDALWF